MMIVSNNKMVIMMMILTVCQAPSAKFTPTSPSLTCKR